MNISFSKFEGAAILKLLMSMSFADRRSSSEFMWIDKIARRLEIITPDVDEEEKVLRHIYNSIEDEQAFHTISKMNYERRRLITAMVVLVMKEDGKLTADEREWYSYIAYKCDLIAEAHFTYVEAWKIVAGWCLQDCSLHGSPVEEDDEEDEDDGWPSLDF